MYLVMVMLLVANLQLDGEKRTQSHCVVRLLSKLSIFTLYVSLGLGKWR
jgi:hypothetical protein